MIPATAREKSERAGNGLAEDPARVGLSATSAGSNSRDKERKKTENQRGMTVCD